MPNVPERQMTKYYDNMQAMGRSLKKARAAGKDRSKAAQVMSVVESIGGATAVGILRGKMEEPDGTWHVPGVDGFDMSLAIGLFLVGGGIMSQEWKPMAPLKGVADDLINAGSGVLAHYAGQIGRKWAKNDFKAFSPIAGVGAHDPYGVSNFPGGSGSVAGIGGLESAALSQTQAF